MRVPTSGVPLLLGKANRGKQSLNSDFCAPGCTAFSSNRSSQKAEQLRMDRGVTLSDSSSRCKSLHKHSDQFRDECRSAVLRLGPAGCCVWALEHYVTLGPSHNKRCVKSHFFLEHFKSVPDGQRLNIVVADTGSIGTESVGPFLRLNSAMAHVDVGPPVPACTPNQVRYGKVDSDRRTRPGTVSVRSRA